ncbi:putative glycoside hydrolase, family 28, pectin lyase/virulence factor [Helianthus annuus]|nr:putative glycoside hydrolase, family 28, pectin lyase/virulence factor [Helianthus annuus]
MSRVGSFKFELELNLARLQPYTGFWPVCCLTLVIGFEGNNGTINGQGSLWCVKYRAGQLKYTQLYLIELMYSDGIQISNLTLIDSPSWNVHPIYSSNIIIQGVTILAPVRSPNTDRINPGNDLCII